jgi:dUTP pyrophosphatase
MRLFLPLGWFGMIAPRSGLMKNKGVVCVTNIIDHNNEADELMITLLNHGNDELVVEVGDRIAQLIFAPSCHIIQTIPM